MSLSNTFRLFLGGPQALWGQMGYIILDWKTSKDRHPNQKPEPLQPALFDSEEQQRNSTELKPASS